MTLHFGFLLSDLLALHLEAGILRLQEVVLFFDALARFDCVYHAEAGATCVVVVARRSLHFELLLLLLGPFGWSICIHFVMILPEKNR